MQSMKKVDGAWKKIQQKTFTNWVNDKLRGNQRKPTNPVKDLATDFADGIRLVDLLEKLAKPKKRIRCNQNPRMVTHRLENLNAALEFIKKEKILLVNIGQRVVCL